MEYKHHNTADDLIAESTAMYLIVKLNELDKGASHISNWVEQGEVRLFFFCGWVFYLHVCTWPHVSVPMEVSDLLELES